MAEARKPRAGRLQAVAIEQFQHAERAMYGAVGVSLALGGLFLFGNVIYNFVQDVVVRHQAMSSTLLETLDGLLFVFIFAELLHTVRVVIGGDALRTEPFLMIGIVAALRRFIVASAEASDEVGKPHFDDLIAELGMLVASVLVLGFTIWLLRERRRDPSAVEQLHRG